jgi:hypothetical protein
MYRRLLIYDRRHIVLNLDNFYNSLTHKTMVFYMAYLVFAKHTKLYELEIWDHIIIKSSRVTLQYRSINLP